MTEPTPAPRGTPNLNKALAAFQADMPTLERDRVVEVETKGDKANYSYNYATLANVTRVAMPLLGKHGLSFTAFPGTGSDGKFSLVYSLLHESGEERTGSFPLSAEGGIQVLGGRITYARRYCLISVTGLAADEDDDAAAAQAEDDANAGTVQRRRSPAADKPAQGRQPAPRSAPTERQTPARQGPPLPGEEDPAAQPAIEPPAPGTSTERMITQPMISKLIVSLAEVGLPAEQQGAFIRDLIQRQITSRKEITFAEGKNLIDAIEQGGTNHARIVSAYRELAAGKPTARGRGRSAPPAETRPVAEQTRDAVLGRPGGPDDEAPPWETEPDPLVNS